MADSAALMDKADTEAEAPAADPDPTPGVAKTMLWSALPCYAGAVVGLLFAAKVRRARVRLLCRVG